MVGVRHADLLGLDDLEREWAGDCTHQEPVLDMRGLDAVLRCPGCREGIGFHVRFGRRQTFMITVTIHGKPSVLGDVDVETAAAFLGGKVSWWEVLGNATDHVKSASVMRVLEGAGLVFGAGTATPADFGAAWDTDCRHRATCELYGNRLTTQCCDCGVETSFMMRDGGFHVMVGDASRGMHGEAEVVEHVRDRVDVLSVPLTMADKMSYDPEGDAADAAALVAVLERHGLIRISKPANPGDADLLADELSVMNVSRDTFEALARAVAINGGKVRATEHGRPIPATQALEAMRLAWPCVFEGVGVKVEYYDPAGCVGFCPKCGFAEDDAAHLRRGCRECGYVGYLLDV